VYKTFLKYLYTDVIDHLPLEESFGEFKLNSAKMNHYYNSRLMQWFVTELLMLCDEYNETELERKCIQMISENVTVSNVAFTYVKAIEYNAKVTIIIYNIIFYHNSLIIIYLYVHIYMPVFLGSGGILF